MKRSLTLMLAPLTALALGGTAQAAVKVSDAWCRATAPGAMTGACYLTLTADAPDRLVSVATPSAAHAMIHDMETVGGVMRMREMKGGLDLPKGQAVKLSPGGRHVMLMHLKGPLTAGGKATLTLGFAKARPQTVTAPIR